MTFASLPYTYRSKIRENIRRRKDPTTIIFMLLVIIASTVDILLQRLWLNDNRHGYYTAIKNKKAFYIKRLEIST